MAELHIIGEIHSAEKFENKTLFCRYNFHCGPNWTPVVGYTEGQTCADSAKYEGPSVWSHPLDIHYICKGVQGWPSISLQIHCVDSIGRTWCVGYGTTCVPRAPGPHTLRVSCWAPRPASVLDRLREFMLGGSTQLTNTECIIDASDRYKLKTYSCGEVTLNLQIILRNFAKFGVEYK